jgi:hypothetical protein
VIRLDDNGTYTPLQNNYVINANIAIEAHTAILHHKNDGPILQVTNGKSFTLLGGTVENATGQGGVGIECDSSSTLFIQKTVIQNNLQSAISSAGCTVTIDSAKLQGNSSSSTNFPAVFISGGAITMYRTVLTQNAGGEIDTHSGASFQIVGNVFQNNGSVSGSNAGISISTSTNATNRLEFNTISANKSQFISGVQCVAGTFTAQNNIIWDNTGSAQLGGTCVHDYSIIGLVVAFPAGTDGGHNKSSDPKLVSEANDPHIQPGSSAIKAANPAADLTGIAAKDIDGDTRTSPADIGADQTH